MSQSAIEMRRVATKCNPCKRQFLPLPFASQLLRATLRWALFCENLIGKGRRFGADEFVFRQKILAGILGEEYGDESPKGWQWILAVGKEGPEKGRKYEKRRVSPPFCALVIIQCVAVCDPVAA